jgi:hypothetical protein
MTTKRRRFLEVTFLDTGLSHDLTHLEVPYPFVAFELLSPPARS